MNWPSLLRVERDFKSYSCEGRVARVGSILEHSHIGCSKSLEELSYELFRFGGILRIPENACAKACAGLCSQESARHTTRSRSESNLNDFSQ